MKTIELVMTVEEAARLRNLLLVEITWRNSANGKAASSIHEALCRVHSVVPYAYLPPQPLVL